MTITHVHGLAFHEEDFKPAVGHPYLRLGVACPYKASLHKCGKHACHKWRGLGAAQTGRRGRLDTIGYLGTWVSRADTFADKASHMRFRPSDEQIDQWLQKHGYIANPCTL
jgi:hypothetical protein